MIGGDFTRIGSVPRPGIARLLADGGLDESFAPSPDFSAPSTNGMITVSKMVLMPDGKIAVRRSYIRTGGVSQDSDLVRLQADGGMDNAFPTLIGRTPLLATPDGRVLVKPGDSPLAMLLSDGAVDPSFTSTTKVDLYYSYDPASLLPNGRFLVLMQNSGGGRIERLMPDGSRDPSFDNSWLPLSSLFVGSGDCLPIPQAGGSGIFQGYMMRVLTHAVQPDGKILVGGQFTYSNYRANLLRLLPNGGFDLNFTGWYRTDYSVRAIAVQPDEKILIGGCFTNVVNELNSTLRLHLARLHPDGSLDTSFNPAPTLRGTSGGYVGAMALQPDGRVLIGGVFDSVNGVPRRNFARLNGDLTLWQSVTTDAQFSTRVATIEGRTYFLETRTTLDPGVWEVVDVQPGTGQSMTLSGPGVSGESRYFRVRVE